MNPTEPIAPTPQEPRVQPPVPQPAVVTPQAVPAQPLAPPQPADPVITPTVPPASPIPAAPVPPQPQPAAPIYPTAAAAYPPQQQAYTQPAAQAPILPSNSKKKLFIIIGASAAVIIAAAIGGFFFLHKKNSPSAAPAVKTPTVKSVSVSDSFSQYKLTPRDPSDDNRSSDTLGQLSYSTPLESVNASNYATTDFTTISVVWGNQQKLTDEQKKKLEDLGKELDATKNTTSDYSATTTKINGMSIKGSNGKSYPLTCNKTVSTSTYDGTTTTSDSTYCILAAAGGKQYVYFFVYTANKTGSETIAKQLADAATIQFE